MATYIHTNIPFTSRLEGEEGFFFTRGVKWAFDAIHDADVCSATSSTHMQAGKPETAF